MKTHDKYTLPPLPDPTYRGPSGTGNYFDGYTKQTLQAYATAAIEADRKHFAEILSALSGDAEGMYEEDRDSYSMGCHTVTTTRPRCYGGEEKSADRKRRGEPVGWEFSLNGDWIRTTEPETHKKMGREVRPLFTTPQPPQIPKGYKIVPVEPTWEMLHAGDVEFGKRKILSISGICYKAMLEAAPTVKQSLTVEHADIRSTSEHSVLATNIAEKPDIVGWLRRRENWKAVCITGQMVREIANMCQSYVNTAPETDQSGAEHITRLIAELAKCRERIGALETIIAACRDAVPLPPSGSEQERLWPDAMSDASGVPAYIAAGFSVVRSTALAEAASVVADHNREGRQWVPGSLWGTITQECAARINSLSETHTFRLQYIEGVGTAVVMEPKK